MTTFGEFIRGEADSRKASQKDLAGAIHNLLDPNSDEFDTVKTKLSKLVNDDPDGARHFFDPKRPDRLRALATVLDTTADELIARRDWYASVKTLVLDPRLPSDIQSTIRESAGDAYRVVLPKANEDVRAALRDAAAEGSNPIVVLDKESEVEMFRLAKLECTLAMRVPRGVKLTRFPDLVPVPPPREPKLFDDDGTLLVPLPKANPYNYSDDRSNRTIRAAIEQGEIPSLPLRDALRYLLDRDSSSIKVVSGPTFKLEHFEGTSSAGNEIWIEDRRLLAIGPRFDELRNALAPYHELHAPPQMELWRRATKKENPWRLVVEAAEPQHALHSVLEPLQRWTRDRTQALSHEMLAPPTGTGSLAGRRAHSELRERVRQLAGRAVDSSAEAVPFILDRVGRASWVVFNTSLDSIELVADMGAGNLVSFRLRTYPNAAIPLQAINPSLFNGGDCVLALVLRSDRRLEGPLLPARERRDIEAESSSDDDYDDD